MPSHVDKTAEGTSSPDTERPMIGADPNPIASVVMVADHDTTRHAGLEDLRSCLQALARQKVDQPVEFLLVETDKRAQRLPADVIAELPGLRVLAVPYDGSYERKNAAVKAAKGEIISLLDVDCTPVSGWLQSARVGRRDRRHER